MNYEARHSDVVTIAAEDGTQLNFQLKGTVPPEHPVFFVGLAKSGSTLLHMLVEDICGATDRRLINISDVCFRAGIRERQIPQQVLPGLPDSVAAYYYGFRLIGHLDRCRTFRRGKKVVLVRDPRDALTSLYFSMQKSHSVPSGGKAAKTIADQRRLATEQSIDDFIVGGNGNFVIDALAEIARHAWLPNMRIYRYEDIIFNKREWIVDFCRFADLPLDETLLDALIERHDVRPKEENSTEHIRQVAPGNFQKHLGARSIKFIEERASEVLSTFGYS